VKALSCLFEFDEKTNKNMPIKLKALSVGSTHCAAVMDNVTKTDTSSRASENETNWGADVLFWGGNEYYQLGTGKRSNTNAPTYIGPLDGGQGDANKGRGGEMHRLCLTPKQTVHVGEGGKGRKVTLEQKVECGRLVTGVYSAV
jgi:alpha-tubulin suppressor-like RCC1 family protein